MFNKKQRLLIFNTIKNSLPDNKESQLLNVYIKENLKGVNYLERKSLLELTSTELDYPKLTLFILILALKIKHGTLEQVGQLVKQNIGRQDIKFAVWDLEKLGFKDVDISIEPEIYDYYMKS